MKRDKSIHVTLSEDERAVVDAMAEDLHFERTMEAMRTVCLAVGGDEIAVARVKPFLGDFLEAVNGKADQEGR